MEYNGVIKVNGEEILFENGDNSNRYCYNYAVSYLKYFWKKITEDTLAKAIESIIAFSDYDKIGKYEKIMSNCLIYIKQLTEVYNNSFFWNQNTINDKYCFLYKISVIVKYNEIILNITKDDLNEIFDILKCDKFKELVENENYKNKEYYLSLISEIREVYNIIFNEYQKELKSIEKEHVQLMNIKKRIKNNENIYIRINPKDDNFELWFKDKNEFVDFKRSEYQSFKNIFIEKLFYDDSFLVIINDKKEFLHLIESFKYVKDRNVKLESDLLDFYNKVSVDKYFVLKISCDNLKEVKYV